MKRIDAPKKSLSKDDRNILKITEQGIHRTDKGHYEIPLLLRNKKVNMPNNKDLALWCLKKLKRRFESKHGTTFRKDYVAFMQDIIDNWYSDPVLHDANLEDQAKSNIWYIPHHVVFHPKKNKIHVVFDCATEFQGQPLNNQLLQGLDMTNNLTGVLCRFRQEPVAVTNKGMFYQFKVNEKHRDLLRFLCWKDGDTSIEPQEYLITVHLFRVCRLCLEGNSR